MRAIVIRTASGAGALEPALRQAVAEVDPNINVLRVISMPARRASIRLAPSEAIEPQTAAMDRVAGGAPMLNPC